MDGEMVRLKFRYVCQSCGYESLKWLGRCPKCGEWNSFLEEKVRVAPRTRDDLAKGELEGPIPITEVSISPEERLLTGIGELDRVLGGGIVPGSLILIGGDPGIGKSTLLLQTFGQLGQRCGPVLYVSGEESLKQTRLRAERLRVLSDRLFLASETDLELILGHIHKLRPESVVIDSIQTAYHPDLESAPGTVSQVRECATRLMYLAKREGVPIFLIGHVTKEGAIAGPKVLEHMVDTVLYFEGERHHFYRILRAVKNRFGSTNEIGVFEMGDVGLVEVGNPSEVFLAERTRDVSGSMVVCSLEGTRPLLIELQALVSSTSYGIPQRVANGIDHRRLSLLLAVLEKRVRLRLGNQDVFVNVAGGVRVEEPAVDLGTVVSITSSFRDLPADPQSVAIGEVGLGGEVRAVNQIEKRVKEAEKLGFKRCVISARNLKGLSSEDEIEVVGVGRVEEALEVLLG